MTADAIAHQDEHEQVLVATAPEYGDTYLVLPPEWAQLPEQERYDNWHSLLKTLGKLSRSSSFWLGDAILYGEEALPEMYSQAVEDTGLARQTLINYVHVCRSVPAARRRAELSFGHHEAVTMLQPGEQEAWLQAAIDNQWSRQSLREAIMAKRGTAPPPTRPQPTPGHDEAVAEVDRAALDAGTVPPPVLPSDEQLLGEAGSETLHNIARDLYGAAVELEAGFADQPNQAYMAVPVLYLQRLGEILGVT
jgi:hypothetical protein